MANVSRGLSGAASGAAMGSMIAPGIGTAIGAIGGGLIGLFSGGDEDARQYIDKMLEEYEGIVPPDLAKQIVYTQLQQGGKLTPQQLSKLPEEAQQVVQLHENPEMRQKQEVQRQALEQLSRTGMGPQEMLALEKSRRASEGDAQARLASIQQKYAQMGQAGGGGSLAAALSASQGAADQEAMTNLQASAQAAENRRNAIQQAYAAASGMRGQDLDVSKYNAENQRQKQMFDTQNAIARQSANAQYANQANQYNLARQQQVADANVQQANQEAYRRQYLAPQQMYANKMQMAGAKSNIYGQKYQDAQAANQASAQNFANITSGLTSAAGAYGQYKNQQNQNDLYAERYGLGKYGKNQPISGVDFGSDLNPIA
jgi:hypothetical protein